jgi:hypothetical protein
MNPHVNRKETSMKSCTAKAVIAIAVLVALTQSGCVGSVGFSIPIGGGYGGWGPSMNVGVSIPFGYPY